MTQILFLIGNGFDLNIGLKTSFSDVLNKYLKIETEDDNIKQFQKKINENFENWSDFEKAMGKYTETFTKDTVDDYLYQIEHFQNFLIQQFKLEEERVDYKTNKEHIISIFRQSLFELGTNLTDKEKRIISPIISKSSGDRKFCYNFITFNYTNIFDKCLEVIEQNRDKFSSRMIADNYGQHKISDSIGKIIHIHGTLQKNFILGVDNVDQILNQEFSKDFDFQWKIVKPLMNRESGNENEDKAQKLIKAASVICIFGMSIGETDTTWWKYIYEWLESATFHYLIIFCYDAKIDKSNLKKIIENAKNIRKKFLSLIDVADDKKGQYEDRIFVAPQNDMFKMDIVSSSEESDFSETPQ